MVFLIFFVLNTYTASSLLALIISVLVVALVTRRVRNRSVFVGTGLTTLFVTPCAVTLIYLFTTWSWTASTLGHDLHTTFLLYGWRPVIVLHIAAALARALLPASWLPSGAGGVFLGCGTGILVGMRRSRRTQTAVAIGPVRLPRRVLFLGMPLALGVLAVPGVAALVLSGRRFGSLFSSAPRRSPTPGSTSLPINPRVNAVTLSPDGSCVAFGENSGLLQVWQVPSQKQLFTRSFPKASIDSVGWSPDGKYLASSGEMGLALWSAQSGVLLRTLKNDDPHTVSLFPLGWSPDSQSIAVSDYWAGKVYVWRVADGTHLFTCDGISVNWSPDGRYLLTGSGPDGPLLAWVRDARTGTLLFTYEGFAQVSGLRQGANFSDILAWSPDSKRVAMGIGDTVHIWDALDGGNLTQYHMPNIDALIWLPGSDLIITGDNAGQVSSWNVADGKVVHTYKQLDPTVVSRTWALTSTPDGAFIAASFLASGSPEKLVLVWETRRGKLLFQYQL